MERDVIVREVGPRDGLQLVKETLPTDTKLNWIKAEAEAGMVEFEVCSFVPPHIIPQFSDARAVAGRALEEIPGIRVMALSPNIKGAEIAFEVGVHVMNYVLSVSKTHNEANVRRSREQSILDFAEIVKMRNADPKLKDTKIGVGLATALGCTLEGDVPEKETLSVLEEVLAAGADEVLLPDTVGYAHPTQVRSLFARRSTLPATCRSSPTSTTPAASVLPTSTPRSKRARNISTPRLPALAAARSRQAQRAISLWRTSSSCSNPKVSRPASISKNCAPHVISSKPHCPASQSTVASSKQAYQKASNRRRT